MTSVYGYTIPALLVIACCLLGRAESLKCCAAQGGDASHPELSVIDKNICFSEIAQECKPEGNRCLGIETEVDGNITYNSVSCFTADACEVLLDGNTADRRFLLATLGDIGLVLKAALETSEDAIKCCDKDYCSNVELLRATALILVVSLFTSMFTMKL